ncbi:hypothetical protein OSTOST_02511 [Ostertagia ostertagi]
MTFLLFGFVAVCFVVSAKESGYTVPQPQHPFGAAEPASGAAVFHIAKTYEVKPVIFQPSPLKSFTAPDPPSAPVTLSAENPHLKRHPGVHLTSLPHKDVYTSKIRGLPSSRREKAVQEEQVHREESHIRKAPEWVEHLSTHSRHRFTIQNLGQSEQVIRQFYKGANGGKPYVTPNPIEEASKTKKKVFNAKEAKEIAEKIIKQELNRAKVAKYGKSAGTVQEANQSGTDGEQTDAAVIAPVERSGYSEEAKAVSVDWSLNNNKVDEFPNGYDESTTFEESAASPSRNLSSTAASGPREIPYPLPKSVDGAVTGHKNCPPCAVLAVAPHSTVLPEISPSSSPIESAPSPDSVSAPVPPQTAAQPDPSPPEPPVEVQRPSEPVVEVPPPEPAVQVQRPSEPVVELPPPTEPAAEVQRPSEPVTEALPPPEPAVEVAPAVMPTSDKHEYSLESSPAHSTAIEPSQSLPEQSAPSPDNGYAIAPSTSSAAQPAPPPSEHVNELPAAISTSNKNEYTEEQLPAVAPAPTSAAPSREQFVLWLLYDMARQEITQSQQLWELAPIWD